MQPDRVEKAKGKWEGQEEGKEKTLIDFGKEDDGWEAGLWVVWDSRVEEEEAY